MLFLSPSLYFYFLLVESPIVIFLPLFVLHQEKGPVPSSDGNLQCIWLTISCCQVIVLASTFAVARGVLVLPEIQVPRKHLSFSTLTKINEMLLLTHFFYCDLGVIC